MMVTEFRRVRLDEIGAVWNILKSAIAKRKDEGSSQWQDGYPNLKVIENDVLNQTGFVLLVDNIIVGYVALMVNNEPAYEKLKGNWKFNGDYIVFHRLAISKEYVGKGFSSLILEEVELFASNKNIKCLRADTNYDNDTMLYLFEKFNYNYRGLVEMRNSPRKAFEKKSRVIIAYSFEETRLSF